MKTTQNLFPLIAAVVVCIATLVARAQTNTSTISSDETKPAEVAKTFGIVLQLTTESNLYANDAPDREAANTLLLLPSINFTDKTSLSAKASLAQQLTQAKEVTYSNTQLNLTHKLPELNSNLSSSILFRGVLPTDEKLRKETSYQGGLGFGGSLILSLSSFTLKYDLSLNRNIHEFTQGADGSANLQYTLSNGLTVQWAATTNLALTVSGLYRNSVTYQNSPRSSFVIDSSAEYTVNKNWSINAGVTNEGPALRANGKDSNIKFYDENTSVIYGGITIIN